MRELLERFLFFGMTKEQAKGAWMFAYRFAILFGVGAGWGWFSMIGVPQFALASDMQKKMDDMQGAVISKLTAAESAQNSTTKLLNRQLSSTVAVQIRLQAQKRCKAKTSDEREAATREIDRLQDEYVQYRDDKEDRYRIPACQEL